jgi:hypothetical protein
MSSPYTGYNMYWIGVGDHCSVLRWVLNKCTNYKICHYSIFLWIFYSLKH